MCPKYLYTCTSVYTEAQSVNAHTHLHGCAHTGRGFYIRCFTFPPAVFVKGGEKILQSL